MAKQQIYADPMAAFITMPEPETVQEATVPEEEVADETESLAAGSSLQNLTAKEIRELYSLPNDKPELKTERLQLVLPASTKKMLKKVSTITGRSMNEIVNTALVEWLNNKASMKD